MLLRPFLNDAGSCASYLFGCLSRSALAVVDTVAGTVLSLENSVVSTPSRESGSGTTPTLGSIVANG